MGCRGLEDCRLVQVIRHSLMVNIHFLFYLECLTSRIKSICHPERHLRRHAVQVSEGSPATWSRKAPGRWDSSLPVVVQNDMRLLILGALSLFILSWDLVQT
jgi:hypothetical protein